MDLYLKLLNFLKRISKQPPVLSILALSIYFIYNYANIYFNNVEALLTVLSGLLLATFILHSIDTSRKEYFRAACLSSALLFLALALFLGFFKFNAADGQIHFRGMLYTPEAKDYVQQHPLDSKPNILIRKYHYEEELVWKDVLLTKTVLLFLNLLVFGSIWLALRLEIENNKKRPSSKVESVIKTKRALKSKVAQRLW